MERHPSTDLEATRLGLLRELHDELWRHGELRWKLHADQLEVYEQIEASTEPRFVMEIARRWGKSFLLAVIAIETCLRFPGCRVVYGAPALNVLQDFILPVFELVIEDAPPDCAPVWHEGNWIFPNGSRVRLFAADDKRKANRGRGPEARLAIFDEAGFCPVLRYVLTSVLRPQLLHSGGRTLLGSTPAEEPEHEFSEIAARAEANGNYARRTIYDNPRLSPEAIAEFIAGDAREEGLSVEAYMATDTFRREYLAQRVIDQLLVVVPEWAELRGELIQRVPRPAFYNGMSVLDFGGSDPHAAIFGYWHFELAKWVVEDEVLLRDGQASDGLVDQLKAKEAELWGVNAWEGTLRGAMENPTPELLANIPAWMAEAAYRKAPTQPFTRWSDNNLELVRALYDLHGMVFIPTAKSDKQLAVNNLRVMVRSKELLLDPRCVHTDRHLRTTIWANHKRKTYRRRGGEHGDLVDTLVYGCRNLDRRDPAPPDWDRRAGQYRQGSAFGAGSVQGGADPYARAAMGRKGRK